MGVDIIKAMEYLLFKRLFMLNDLVGRTYDYASFWVGQYGVPRTPNSRRSRIELHGFGQDIGLGEFGQLTVY